METLIVRGTILCDGKKYEDGQVFPLAEFADRPEIVAELRAAGALKTPAEVLAPEELNQLLAAQALELQQLRALVGDEPAAEASDKGAIINTKKAL